MKSYLIIILLAAVLMTVLKVSPCEATMVNVSWYADVGMTRVWRAEVKSLITGPVSTIIIKDSLFVQGADGVFSGFDVDFVLMDEDGDLSTTGDQILPFLDTSCFVVPGNVTNQAGSPYQPTAAHPGVLFGLNTDDSIDHLTATLGVLDADPYIDNGVDSCSGAVSLGEGGSLYAEFSTASVSSDHLYLFFGEAGKNECFQRCNGIKIIPEPATMMLLGLGAGGLFLRRQRR